MPRRSRSPAPLGAFKTPKRIRHAAVGAQNCRRHAPRPPGEAAASLRTISTKITRRQEQQSWQGVRAPRQATARTSTRSRLAGAQTWRKRRRGKPCHGRGGGHSRRCRHPKPPGINPAQQNAGSRHQTPHNPQPRVAPRRNLGDAAVICHAVSELLLADGPTEFVVARNCSLRRQER